MGTIVGGTLGILGTVVAGRVIMDVTQSMFPAKERIVYVTKGKHPRIVYRTKRVKDYIWS